MEECTIDNFTDISQLDECISTLCRVDEVKLTIQESRIETKYIKCFIRETIATVLQRNCIYPTIVKIKVNHEIQASNCSMKFVITKKTYRKPQCKPKISALYAEAA